ncbi:MAG: agmatine deiminase family protein [Bacteroidetes bacterium]|nr:agmatine deiminase family protein [Bacteroidota bacterium]
MKETVYVSAILYDKFPKFASELAGTLSKYEIPVRKIDGTNDIWCRDYMPIQVNKDKFVQFKFDPDYLKDLPHLISNPTDIHIPELQDVIVSDLIVDGGNVIKHGKKLITTDKIFIENSRFSIDEIRNQIARLLEIETHVTVPCEPGDFTGHADGMVRFINDNTVLINDFSKTDKSFFASLLKSLESNFNIEVLPYHLSSRKSKYGDFSIEGNYVNFLDLHDIIVLPIYSLKLDDVVYGQLTKVYPNKTILTVKANDVALYGGSVNCVTWNRTEMEAKVISIHKESVGVDGTEVKNYVFEKISFPLTESIYVNIDDAIGDFWDSVESKGFFNVSEIKDAVSSKLKAEKILIGDERSSEIVDLVFEKLLSLGVIK